jgi:hypothetical protein
MSTAATWTSEYETTGRVVFPQRRSRLLIRLVFFALLMASSLVSNLQHLLAGDVSGTLGVLRFTALAGFVCVVGITVWQLITRRPVVTVDRFGITSGKDGAKGLVPWERIARIDAPSGLPGLRTVQVQPLDKHGSTALGISQDNVQELAELTDWLRTLHQQQRAD